MEFGKSMDVSAFDWDDTALIEEYDRIMKSTKKAISKSKSGKSSQNKEKAKGNQKPFEAGDYCQAIYKEDGLFYEATIIDIHKDTCTVEFLGYGDLEEVTLDSLEESNGRKARQKQRKKAKQIEDAENYISDSDISVGVEKDQTDKTIRPIHPQYSNNMFQQWGIYSREQSAQPLQPSYLTSAGAFNQTSAPLPPPPINCMQRVGDNLHGPIPPPPPPMPHCSAVAKDPSLSAMLVSWYMAGYYTGLHQNQKSTHCSTAAKSHCCDHHHHHHT